MTRISPRLKRFRRPALLFAALIILWIYFACAIMNMPGHSWSGPLPALTAEETAVRDRLRAHVLTLAGQIGERNTDRSDALVAAGYFISEILRQAGYTPGFQPLEIKGITQVNIEAARRGATHPDRILVVGAHYDTVPRSPGADDNASGVAALLELARLLHGRPLARTVRFVFFFNEEGRSLGPNGAEIYARACRDRRENIIGMISLEMLGFYTDAPRSQSYPLPIFKLFYPSTGDFVSFVGNFTSRRFVHQTVGAFRTHARFPSRGAAVPDFIQDANRSDHYSFWLMGYPGLMVTDTANFRNRHYHKPHDTPETLDYDRAARVTVGLVRAVERLASE